MEYQITRVSTDVPDDYHLAIDYTALQDDGFHPALMKSKFSHDPGFAVYSALLGLKPYLLDFLDFAPVPDKPTTGDYEALPVTHPAQWERARVTGYQIKTDRDENRTLILYGVWSLRRGQVDVETPPIHLVSRKSEQEFLENPEDDEKNPRPYFYVPGLLDALEACDNALTDYLNLALAQPSPQLDIKFGKEHIETIRKEFEKVDRKIDSGELPAPEGKKRGKKKDPLPDSTAEAKGYPVARSVDFHEQP